MKKQIFGASSGATLALALCLATPALGQTNPVSSENAVEVITVTAQRRSENLQRVPLSVAVVSGNALRDAQAGGEDILALSGRVPSLYAETTTGRIFPRFYLRGLGNIDFYLGAAQPVSIIQDDVVMEHVVLKSNPVFDIKQVEVLRGPQGSLFGRNTTAGIIKFDTIKPSNDFNARLSASIGTYNTSNLDFGVGGPIVDDKLMFRASLLLQTRDNWIDNTFTGASADGSPTGGKDVMGGFKDLNGRIQLLYTPFEGLSILTSAHARTYDGTSTIFRRAGLAKGSNDLVANLRPNKTSQDEAFNNPQAYDMAGASVRASWDLGSVTLTSITAYETANGFSRGDTDGGATILFGGNNFGQSMGKIDDLDQFSQELRIASDATGAFKWQGGVYLFQSTDFTEFYQRAFFTGVNLNNWVRLKNTNDSWAVFAQGSYDLTEALTITAGARFTEDKKRTRLLKTANTAANVVTYTGRRDVELSGEEPSWDISALYRVNDGVNLYARAARGFRGPTIQGRSAVFNADFTQANSETIVSYEVGVKSQLWDKKLLLNAAAFTYTVNDIQLNGNDANGNGVLFNADKAVASGLEADFQFLPFSGLSIGGGVSLLSSEIQDTKVYAQVCGLNGVIVCTVADPTIRIGNNVFAQIDGNPLPNAPEWNLNLNARYNLPLQNGGAFFAATDWNMQGKTSLVLYESTEFVADGNFEGGVQLGYQAPQNRWELALFARNVTNELNLKGGIENFMAPVVNDPRIVGVSVKANF